MTSRSTRRSRAPAPCRSQENRRRFGSPICLLRRLATAACPTAHCATGPTLKSQAGAEGAPRWASLSAGTVAASSPQERGLESAWAVLDPNAGRRGEDPMAGRVPHPRRVSTPKRHASKGWLQRRV